MAKPILSEKGFGLVEVIAAVALLILSTLVGFYVWSAHRTTSASKVTQSLTVNNSEKTARFSGEVTNDGCTNRTSTAPIGDVGCSIVVNGKTVGIVHGNMRYPNGWGTIKGFSPSQDITGRHVAVYARQNGSGNQYYDLGGSGYYVELTN